MKYSTGRGSRLKHSTAIEWAELEKAKKKNGHRKIKHSTGEKAAVRHFTGREFDYRALIERPEENGEIHSEPILEGDEGLEFCHKSQGKKKHENMKNREHKQATKRTGRKEVINRSLKKMVVRY